VPNGADVSAVAMLFKTKVGKFGHARDGLISRRQAESLNAFPSTNWLSMDRIVKLDGQTDAEIDSQA